RAVALDPAAAAAQLNLGNALAEAGRTEEAMAAWRASIAAAPGRRDARLNLARALLAADAPDEAAAQYEAARRATPEDDTLDGEYGAALARAGRTADAVAVLRRALIAAPDSPALVVNLGNTLCMAGKPRDAVPLFEKAAALDPDCADTRANLGHALKQAGDLGAAAVAYDRALMRAPDHREALFGRGTCRLLAGDFTGGWQDYRARDSMAGAGAGPAFHRAPLPADLSGRRVLVLPDQGIGDELFFLRFLPALATRGAEIACRPDPRLRAMLERARICRILDADAPGESYDFTVAVGDLPAVLGSTATPPSVALDALPDREAALRERLTAFGPPPWIGVTWRAGTRNRQNLLFKESPAAMLADALRPLDARVVVLQRAPDEGEVEAFSAALGRAVLDLSELNADIEDMLGLVGLLTGHVCVSNTNVHLAAARRRVCRILVPNPPEFRWMASGDVSPWFPAMPVYRQDADGDWTGAFARLRADLEDTAPDITVGHNRPRKDIP
ncbi:MAG: tetratricopeptide repeat protein, partial [Alphaproteobacteria bacterium]|nr:tetratricopeptide repeat protein [Alphaproteobacteria bacterium]